MNRPITLSEHPQVTLFDRQGAIPKIEEQLAKERQAVRKLTEQFEKVEAKYHADCAPHENAIRQLRQQDLEANQAKQRLLQSVMDPRLKQRQAELLKERQQLVEHRREQTELVGRVDARRRKAEAVDLRLHPEASVDLERVTTRLEEERRKLAEIEERMAELDQEMLELQTRMLEA